jgi:hypothetical protein
MKTLFAFALMSLSMISVAHAEFRGADMMYTIVGCSAGNGVTLTITSGGFAGITLAHVFERDRYGRQNLIAKLPVREVNLPARQGLSPVQVSKILFVGDSFRLTLQPSMGGSSIPGGIQADVGGRRYNQALSCQFYSHTM